MMKIAVIFSETAIPDLFSVKTLDGLKKLGDVVLNSGKATVESLKETIKDADVAVTSWGTPPLSAEILGCAPNLKLLIHAAGSVKPIVTDEFWKHGIKLINSAKPLGEGVAETALGFTITASKNFYNLNAEIHNGGYRKGYDEIRELYDRTVGVIGTGWAGRHYLKLMQNFNVDLIACDPYISAETLAEYNTRKVELDELLSASDIVSIHAPSIPETYRMINAETLKLMKPDAVLINTARGSLIDENALYEHMAAGNLKYACLDVYDPEPPSADSPLRNLPNCIMTPHLAGLAANGKLRLGAHTLYIIDLYTKGEKLPCEVTEDMLATMA